MVKMTMVEKGASPLAVVCFGGMLGKEVARQLRKEGLRVRHLEKKTDAVTIWEKPEYVFLFEKIDESWGQAKVLEIKVKGKPKTDQYWLTASTQRIVKTAFSSPDKELVLLGQGGSLTASSTPSRSLEVIWKSLNPKKRDWSGGRRFYINLAILLLVLLLVSPFVFLGLTTVGGFTAVLGAMDELRQNNTLAAETLANQAVADFATAKQVTRTVAGVLPVWAMRDFSQRFYGFLDLGDKAADLVVRTTILLPAVQYLVGGVLESKGGVNISAKTEEIRLELAPMSQDLGFIEGQLDQILTNRLVRFLAFWGFSTKRVSGYRSEIGALRQTIFQADQLLAVLPEVLPTKEGETRTYLVVLQNSAELRPTGGFIGSYGLVNLVSGHVQGFKIFDVYATDGQLRGHVDPPDEILHYLGQPSWFMRDANWAPDWPLTAKRLEWFLNKETGVSVDGVIGVDLGAVQKILKAMGPVILSQGEVVTAENFFDKAEFAAEINFFAGSDQKPQFLGQVAQGLLTRLSSVGNLDWLAFGQAATEAVKQKDILVYFNSLAAQKVMLANDWSGSIMSNCQGENANCLGIVEANLGTNKANYFIKRNIRVDGEISRAGEVDMTVVVNYKNESPNATWPGGNYKNYLRFLVPTGSKFTGLDLGDKRQASVSGVLMADVIKSLSPDQFLVFKSQEQAIDQVGVIDAPLTSYGTLVTVPVQTEGTVTFRYRPPYTMNFSQMLTDFNLKLIRQPGAGVDAVDFALDYPSFLTPVWDPSVDSGQVDRDVSVLALPQKLVYNMELSQDREIKVRFRRE